MNARLTVLDVTDTLGLQLAGRWSPEAERTIVGSALLGDPMPRWLKPEHFFPTQHQRIYEAIQTVGGNVSHVNAWLRESAPPFGPLLVESTELAEMCLEAEFARKMGWSLDEHFETVRELWRQRGLLEQMARVAIQLRAGTMVHEEARVVLREHFQGHR